MSTGTRIPGGAERHDCPGLYKCTDHPRVSVIYSRGERGFYVVLPGDIAVGRLYRNHAAALHLARQAAQHIQERRHYPPRATT